MNSSRNSVILSGAPRRAEEAEGNRGGWRAGESKVARRAAKNPADSRGASLVTPRGARPPANLPTPLRHLGPSLRAAPPPFRCGTPRRMTPRTKLVHCHLAPSRLLGLSE